jgi:type IV secretory pathway TraG/TraD family ATPase VirD4
MTSTSIAWVIVLAAGLSVALGAVAAWWMHRRTRLSPRNAYLAWGASIALGVGAGATGQATFVVAAALMLIASTTAAVTARRWRLSALGAGGELREHEQDRVMFWTALGQRRQPRERVTIAGQGEVVRHRQWPSHVRALPMTGEGRAPVSLREGHHQLFVGATGSGKTTSARRVLLARGLAESNVAVLAVDPQSDPGLEHDLRAIAAARERPYVVFDPYDPASDRWNPIWADDPGAVVARLVAPVEANPDSDASHYSRVLRVHLGLVCEALHAAGRWPVALPTLLRVAQRPRFGRLVALAGATAEDDPDLLERLKDHEQALAERVTQGQLDGSLRALEVVAGQAWRNVLTPGAHGAVPLPAAMAAGAVVLWKTHVEDIKEEAETITTLALADIGAAARTLSEDAQWVLLLDEFGSVLQGRAGGRAIALMQRARSTHGQVLVSTQSVSDIPSATGNQHLLGALTDNFTAFIAHRQASPESRDWLAKLFGTREIWQSTDRTMRGRADGTGSRRRAAEFIIRPDEFRQLGPGEAFIATTLGPPPERAIVTPGPRLDARHAPTAKHVYRPLLSAAPDELLMPAAATTQSAAPTQQEDAAGAGGGGRGGTGQALWE